MDGNEHTVDRGDIIVHRTAPEESRLSMGIYIRGKQMPKTCEVCILSCLRSVIKCDKWAELSSDRREHSRPLGCPLIEVEEPHGRLVDIDKMIRIVESGVRLKTGELSELTTVIEAEE